MTHSSTAARLPCFSHRKARKARVAAVWAGARAAVAICSSRFRRLKRGRPVVLRLLQARERDVAADKDVGDMSALSKFQRFFGVALSSVQVIPFKVERGQA